jgi:hypothetical protein
MANQARKKKGGKGCPKLRRIAKHKAKYAEQVKRTFRNKYRRVLQHNGEAAAAEYARRYAAR